MSDRRAKAYRKLVLRSARIRVGTLRVSGLPAILLGVATVVWATCAGGALLALGIAAALAAAKRERRERGPGEHEALERPAGEFEALVIGERPGLRP